MATVTLNTLSTSVIVLANNDQLVIGGAGVLAGASVAVNTNASVTISVLGTISGNGPAIHLPTGSAGTVSLVVGEGASLTTHSSFTAISFNDASLYQTLANHGTITSAGSDACVFRTDSSDTDITFLNTGTISGRNGGVELLNFLLTGDNAVLVNSGLIVAQSQDTVLLSWGTAETILNSGTILNTGAIGRAAVLVTGRVENSGLISSPNVAVGVAAAGTLVNTGEIVGEVQMAFNTFIGGDTTVLNHGRIVGDVSSTVGADIVTNRGLIDGTVRLGTADDIFRGRRGETLGTVSGEAGADTLLGGNSDEDLNGGADNDLLRGGGGDDVLTGATGKDQLSGGRGADSFVFVPGDSATGKRADTITDFNPGEDLIDLSAFTGKLAFLGAGGFTGAAGQLRLKAAGAATVVQVDTDGNAKSDFEIKLLGVASLSAADFLL